MDCGSLASFRLALAICLDDVLGCVSQPYAHMLAHCIDVCCVFLSGILLGCVRIVSEHAACTCLESRLHFLLAPCQLASRWDKSS